MRYTVFSVCLLLAACQSNEKAADKSAEVVKDSIKADTIKTIVADTVSVAPALSGDAALVANKWKAESVEMKNGIKLSEDIIDLRFTFKNDLTFDFSEDNKSDSGTWKLSDDSKTLELTYKNSARSKLKVKELKSDKLVLSGKEHGLERTYVLKLAK